MRAGLPRGESEHAPSLAMRQRWGLRQARHRERLSVLALAEKVYATILRNAAIASRTGST